MSQNDTTPVGSADPLASLVNAPLPTATATGTANAAAAAPAAATPASASATPGVVSSDIKLITLEKPATKDGREVRETLNPADLQQAKQLAAGAKIENGLVATQFGLEIQKAIAAFTAQDLKEVKVKDSGLGGVFDDFAKEVNGLDVSSLASANKGWFDFVADIPFIGKRAKAFRAILRANQKLETRVVEIEKKMAEAKSGQSKTAVRMEALQELNEKHMRALQIAIAAGEFKLQDLVDDYNRQRLALANSSDLAAKNKLMRFGDTIIRLMARVQNMRKALLGAETTNPMIGLVYDFALNQISGIDDFLTMALPEFRKRLVIGLSLYNQKKVAQMLTQGRLLGDKLLAGNAQLLSEVQAAVQENQRQGIGSADVLVQAVADINKTLMDKVTGIKTTMEFWEQEKSKLDTAHKTLIEGVSAAEAEMAKLNFGQKPAQ